MHFIMMILLTPSSEVAMPLQVYDSIEECIIARPLIEAGYRTDGWGFPQTICVPISFAPETSPRPKGKP